ncbi:alpha/beta fold hydrolase [Alisedimentitalea sp. MJ-SS2]|uniref:alpha/beta hydrolase n=1 Tax=Aliisedimentitalea sp. MJ-SS2 TaxID=3049795 RepID=UPI0029135E9F|nr:alpha/beta fold hydrolase [Alisedimentitalea sp. MJ-SS2]MDU8927510.1 alpha/beta fold hydrolase [Alisedimentitalea sp. MJ-SS2]
MRVLIVFLSLTLVAGCTRHAVTGFSDPVAGLEVQRLFVATQRTAGQVGQIFGEHRSSNMHYGRISISIPPGHKPGRIERTSGIANPEKHFAPLGVEPFHRVGQFTDRIRSEQVANGAGNGSVLVYVHGYNNTMEDAAYRLAQIRHDFEITEPAILFSWPSAGDPRGYIYDRDSVLFARDGFEQLIRDLRARGQREIVIVAHSMGAYLTMEALRQMALKGDRYLMDAISTVALMSPDIDPDVFRQQAVTIGRLPRPFLILTSQKDKVLGLAEFLTGRKQRLGRIKDESEVAGLGVTVLDVTDFTGDSTDSHNVAATSGALIKLLRGVEAQIRQGGGDAHDFFLLGKEKLQGVQL